MSYSTNSTESTLRDDTSSTAPWFIDARDALRRAFYVLVNRQTRSFADACMPVFKPDKRARWFDIFRLRSTAIEARPGRQLPPPKRCQLHLSLAQRARWKRRRHLQELRT